MTEMKERWLTDAEQELVGRAMLAAAIAALGEPVIDDAPEVSKRVLRSLAAAERSKKAEADRLSRGGEYLVFVVCESVDVVATAFWMWDEGRTDADVHPESVAGQKLLGFARAMVVAQSVGRAMAILDEQEMNYAFLHAEDGALKVLKDAAS